MHRIRIITLILLLCCLSARADYRRAHLRDSIRAELPRMLDARDSLSAYLNIFDLSDHKDVVALIRETYPVARRAHNITAQLELLQRLANTYRSSENPDSLFEQCHRLADALPQSDMQRGTSLFIDMLQLSHKSASLPDSARRDFFQDLIMDYPGDDKSSLVDKIRYNYAVVLFIGGRQNHPMRPDNLEHLGDLVRQLPPEMEAVRNLYYLQAAIIYTKLGEKQLAVSADRYLLNGMKTLASRYSNQNRIYRSFAPNIYNCYRRMMMNYEALAPGEADSIYNHSRELAMENFDVAEDMMNDGRLEGYYCLAKGRDAEAIAPLLEQVYHSRYPGYRHILLHDIIGAAERACDTKTLLEVMPLYIQDLEDRFSMANLSKAIDRETDYQLSDYQRSKDSLDREVRERREKLHAIIIGVTLAAAVVLLVLLFMLYRLYTRSKRLSRSLAQSNEALISERDKLRRSERDLIAARDRAGQATAQKADFISNMSREVSAPLSAIIEYSQFIVDNMDAGRRKYMENFADVVTLSGELLQTLINDLLDTSAIERSEIELTRTPMSVRSICNVAIANMSKRFRPGVELICDIDPGSDPIITTDPQRVEQVLINLLSNAAKFTEEGSVTLSYEFDSDRSHLSFIVTDTGIGIPAGKEEIIFGRFEKLDTHTQGSGLGLYISTLIAKLLGGEIRVDTTYTDGARFVFTIPV